MDKPIITDAPGVHWRRNRHGWEARWRPRHDLVEKGYPKYVLRLWGATRLDPVPTETAIAYIRDRARALQDDMLNWAAGLARPTEFNGTIRNLILWYQTDPDSPYKKTRYVTRRYYDKICRLIDAMCGDVLISEIKMRQVLRWHEQWMHGGRVAAAHAKIVMLRTLMSFGATILEDEHCARVSGSLSQMKFKMATPRKERLTAEHAIAIRSAAHRLGRPSIALAQALQFDLMFRQKDCIGEYVPFEEPGPLSDVLHHQMKWIRGVRWEEIDEHLILRHTTSKKNKDIEIDLTLAPMVMEEFALRGWRTRADMPASGPIVISEDTGRPWKKETFRTRWRAAADQAGVPRSVKNMDSRAGAISEATDAGVELEHIRHAATHSDIATTQRYSRGATDKVAQVMKLRTAHRTGRKQDGDQ